MTTQQPGQDEKSEIAQAERLLASSDLMRALESDEFKAVLDRMPIGIATSRRRGERHRVVYVNEAFRALVGPSAAEGSTWDFLAGSVRDDEPSLTLAEAIRSGEDFLGIFRLPREAAEPLMVQAYASQISNEDGSENYRIAALVDVTHRERAQHEDFERKIEHKDLLLKELQHRVKNNLQLITAMIRLERRNARDGAEVDLGKLAGRIEALALLYDAIYGDQTANEIDLGNYLGQIAAGAMRVHALDGIRLNLTVSYTPVSINVGMPVGLLVNELFTNAFKYAFAGREHGELTLSCERADDRYRVIFKDNGIGLPPGSEWPSRGKLGALILQTLRENARDTALEVTSAAGAGTCFALTFTHTPPSARKN